MNVVQCLENCRRAKKSTRKSVEELLKEMSDIMDVKLDAGREFGKSYCLNNRFVIVLFELSLVVVIERISGIEVTSNSK